MSTIPPDLISGLTTTVAADIQTLLPHLRTCEPVDGEFDAQELKRVSTHPPAVLIAVLGAQQAATPAWPQIQFDLTLAAFIVTKNRGAMTGTAEGLNIAQAVLALIPERAWENEAFGPAQNVRWRNANTKETRTRQVVLSAVTWTQSVILQASDSADPVNLQVYASRAPEIGAAHVADYTEVSS